MALSRCPDCGRVIDGASCFACGYEMPAPSLAELPPDERINEASRPQRPAPLPEPAPEPEAIELDDPVELVEEAAGMVHDSLAEAGLDAASLAGPAPAVDFNEKSAAPDFGFNMDIEDDEPWIPASAIPEPAPIPAQSDVGLGLGDLDFAEQSFDPFGSDDLSQPAGEPFSSDGDPFAQVPLVKPADAFSDVTTADPVHTREDPADDPADDPSLPNVDDMFDAIVEPPGAEKEPSDISEPDEISISDRLLALAFTLRSEDRARDGELVEQAAELLKSV